MVLACCLFQTYKYLIIANDNMISAGQQNLNRRNKIYNTLYADKAGSNKQNINKNQMQKSIVAKQYQKKIEILTQSALSALVQKQEIIQQLTYIRSSCDPNTVEIEELSLIIQQLQIYNHELRNSLEDAVKKLDQERHQWNQEHFKLTSEIQRLRDEFRKIQNTLQLAQNRNYQLNNQNQLVYQEIHQLQTAYKIAKQQILASEEKIYSQAKSISLLSIEDQKENLELKQAYLVQQEQIEKSIHQIINQQKKDKLYSLKESLSYQTQEWLENHQVQTSIRQQHSLKGSLKALNLIDGYSVNSKHQIIEDSQSQFTTKYFKYTNDTSLHLLDKTLHDSCEHIPEEPEDEFDQQHKINMQLDNSSTNMYVWIQRASCFVSGVCLGAFLIWKWKK